MKEEAEVLNVVENTLMHATGRISILQSWKVGADLRYYQDRS